MASYLDSILLEVQTTPSDSFNQSEFRRETSRLLQLFMQSGRDSIRDYEALKLSNTRPLSVHMFKRVSQAVGEDLGQFHTGNPSDSFKENLTFKNYVRNFSVALKRSDNSFFSDSEILRNELINASRDIHKAIDTDLSTYLNTNRTLVAEPTANVWGAEWITANATDFHYSIPASGADSYPEVVKFALEKNGYQGVLDIIGDQPAYANYRKLRENGTTNAENFSYQTDDQDFWLNYNATPGLNSGNVFAMQKGSVGFLPWLEPANRRGEGTEDGRAGMIGTIADPLGSGLTFGISIYKDRADTTSTGGNQQDFVTQMQLHVQGATIHQSLSTADASPIFKIISE